MKKETIIRVLIKREGEFEEDYLEKGIEGELLYCPEGTLITLAEDWDCERVKLYSVSLTKNKIVAYIHIEVYFFFSEEEILAYKRALIREGFKLI